MALPTMSSVTPEDTTLSPPPVESPAERIEERAVRATLVCVARHGLAKTTFDDVAREAGCARATLYRYFGGKRQLVLITTAREAARIAASIRAAADAGQNVGGAAVGVLVVAGR